MWRRRRNQNSDVLALTSDFLLYPQSLKGADTLIPKGFKQTVQRPGAKTQFMLILDCPRCARPSSCSGGQSRPLACQILPCNTLQTRCHQVQPQGSRKGGCVLVQTCRITCPSNRLTSDCLSKRVILARPLPPSCTAHQKRGFPQLTAATQHGTVPPSTRQHYLLLAVAVITK